MELNEQFMLDMFNKYNVLEVEFTKADGSKRTMICTKDLNNVPIEHHPKPVDPDKPPKPYNPNLCTVYEIGVGWRSFYYEKLINAKPVKKQAGFARDFEPVLRKKLEDFRRAEKDQSAGVGVRPSNQEAGVKAECVEEIIKLWKRFVKDE